MQFEYKVFVTVDRLAAGTVHATSHSEALQAVVSATFEANAGGDRAGDFRLKVDGPRLKVFEHRDGVRVRLLAS